MARGEGRRLTYPSIPRDPTGVHARFRSLNSERSLPVSPAAIKRNSRGGVATDYARQLTRARRHQPGPAAAKNGQLPSLYGLKYGAFALALALSAHSGLRCTNPRQRASRQRRSNATFRVKKENLGPKLENYNTSTPYNLNDIGIESIMIYMKLKKLTNGRRGVPALHITAAPGRGE